MSEEMGHVPILQIPLHVIQPSPENDTLYKPIDTADPEFRAFAARIKANGVKEPLVLTHDNFILSGHRRYAAARLARLQTVPCRYDDIYHDDPNFVSRLRLYNDQRKKSIAEQLRESIIDADPEEAYRALIEHRAQASSIAVDLITITGETKRARITDAKEPFLRAIRNVLQQRRNFWPLSDRAIHYALLNDAPLIHASKPDSRYENNLRSYKALTELLTRARLAGRIPHEAIADETRPVNIWDVHNAPSSFFKRELGGFLKGYRRNLQQSQPNHIEIVGEKNTIGSTLRPVAGRYNIPLTIGRGFSSLEPRYQMVQRFKRSGKNNLVLLVLSDFDPSGESICHSFARSLRDDFGVRDIAPIKVALTAEHVRRFNLPPNMEAKQSDSRAAKFVAEHGAACWELEALTPETIQSELSRVIDEVLDIDAFNAELAAEREDATYLAELRQRAQIALEEVA